MRGFHMSDGWRVVGGGQTVGQREEAGGNNTMVVWLGRAGRDGWMDTVGYGLMGPKA